MIGALLTVFALNAEPPAPPEPPPSPKNELFFEALGSGLLYSVNYERFVDLAESRHHLGFRGGASFFTWSISDHGGSGNLTLVSFPFVGSYYFVWGNHRLQLGAGATVLWTGAASDDAGQKFDTQRSGLGVAVTAAIGYRYVPRNGGFTFGVAFTPLIRPSDFLPWGGADVGWAF